MALGGNVLRQHVVEFIRGTGIVTDGVVDATSLNGPWSWQVPDGVAQLQIDGCAAGGGGGGGQSTGTVRGGGSGGAAGATTLGATFSVLPSSALTITLGAGGIGGTASGPGAPQAQGGKGGDTSISGLLPRNSSFAHRFTISEYDVDPTALVLLGGGSGVNSGTAGNGAVGGSTGSGGNPNRLGLPGSGAGGATAAATPGGGSTSGEVLQFNQWGGLFIQQGGCGSGAGSTTPTTNGSGGGSLASTGGRIFNSYRNFQDLVSTGYQDGTNSYGGGGQGGACAFGYPGRPGHSTVPDADNTLARGFGYGGSGGRGSGNGSPGGDGYVRFTYWSMD